MKLRLRIYLLCLTGQSNAKHKFNWVENKLSRRKEVYSVSMTFHTDGCFVILISEETEIQRQKIIH